ncbi:alanine--tRNA ligase [Megalodesulfovibrio gigas]|uniref:Alanine--tRNA ligase n=1 Tax=Megalodesulfovibrio gigas (strain ATCC 19364 / DSM 1382 / NCIMB 9332 / VKM B-1759) TaxID=1121448 RepID=T2GCB8_MEGG1|nr:alanine--tRNA ligase [Megalodesulfovibrio gigas]AGW13766.1 putative alanyl-tRNA synthetase [Megalodesulfovibrio gigas DSM 1382 = ATCC 19364]
MFTADEIRRRFIDFFAAKGHAPVASSGLVPKDDPTLLFTNAGMVQFKNVFLGQEVREYRRAVTSQKCLRVGGKHNDLENVGRTARHHTFFEMLGNFSFGDYFKREAISFAWEFLTQELKLPKDRLYVTIFRDDDDAGQLWQDVANVPPDRIYKMGEKDNFWSMGDTGPCGPCSEILFDQGEQMSCGEDCGIGLCDCDRFLEIWNLVFMQYDQLPDGTRMPLPKPSIDTGMGLERISAVCQGVQSNFDINLFQDIIRFAASLADTRYGATDDGDTALRVIADHARATAFLIADGILPSNEGRGYVLRRLIRRALRFGTLIGLKDPFLHKVCGEVVRLMGVAFPELLDNADFMQRVVREEEDRFSQTLGKGLIMLEEEMAARRTAGDMTIAGEFAFKLYDTFGFPLDIVKDVVERQGFCVDEAGFTAHMQDQKTRAKAAWKGSGEAGLAGQFRALLEQGISSRFVGYDTLTHQSEIVALLDEAGQLVESLPAGAKGYLVARATPFYGESGGQLGDGGACATATGQATVTDTLKPSPDLTVHVVEVRQGSLAVGQDATLDVAEGKRTATARNHTTTHLLQAALRSVLGEHVKQAGSLVGPDRMRFDFTHIAALTAEEIARVEEQVNAAILKNIPVSICTMDYEAAVARGAMALFGEKYTDQVRVVEAPGVSVELCGGTHLTATGQAGSFVILSETGVAAGVRRIEAATGWNALQHLMAQRQELGEIAGQLKAQPGESARKVQLLLEEVKALKKENEKLAAKAATAASGGGGSIMDAVETIGGVQVLAAKVDAPSVKVLRDLMDDVRSKLPSGVALLAAEAEGKAPLILYVSKDLHGRFTAPSLIKDVAAVVGGSGGGRPDLAQAGGTEPGKIAEAIAKLKELVAG